MGERAASFGVFYDGQFPSVCRALTLALGDAPLAEDAAQEAFTRAYVYWRRVSAMDRPAGWVYVVAIRIAFRRRQRVALETAGSGDTGATVDFTDGVVERESLRRALAQLPERQRIAIVLRYLADLPIADVAQAMGCAVGTAKSTLHAARERLGVELGVEDEEEVQDAR